MASFTAVNDVLELVVPIKGTVVDIDISGTYNQDIELQRELGSPGSGAWEKLRLYNTEDATEADNYTTQSANQTLRLFMRVDNGGTATVTLADNEDKEYSDHTMKDAAGNTLIGVNENSLVFNGAIRRTNGVFSIAAAVTLTAAAHAGRILTFDIAAGVTVTLPAATGTGNIYEFVVGVTVTSVNDVIQVANATDEFHGHILNVDTDTSDANASWPALDGDGFDTITLNGSTKGGIMGDWIKIVDYASGKFLLVGHTTGTGTVVTPLSAAV